nr:hypothetical protein [Accumulibacter sp.]
MPQLDGVRAAVEKWCIPILEYGGHFGVQRSEHDQAADDLRRTRSEAIDFRLQQRTEVSQLLAVEILELIERHHVTGTGQPPDQLCQFTEAGNPRVDTKRFQIAVAGGYDTCGVGIRDLNVERSVDGGCTQRLLDQRCLADTPSSGNLQEELSPPLENALHLLQLGAAAIERPGSHVSHVECVARLNIKVLTLTTKQNQAIELYINSCSREVAWAWSQS